MSNNHFSAITLRNVQKQYKAGEGIVLNNISLSIDRGLITGIIGRSGAGKSTLIRCLNGLETIDAGEIILFGQDFAPMKDCIEKQKRRSLLNKCGTIFQTFNLLSHRTALENTILPLEWLGVDSASRTKKGKELLSLVGLGALENKYPCELSGGQRQRIAIARALSTDPELLLCDEFTSALDPETALEILSFLRHLNKQLGVTIVLVTHDLSVVRECCDHVFVLDKGHVVEQGNVAQVLLSPQHAVTQSLVSGLFLKDLPVAMLNALSSSPQEGGTAILRLIYAGTTATEPIISTFVQKYQALVSIVAGHLDHIREQAFGSLIITIPYSESSFSTYVAHFNKDDLAAQVVGYLRA